MRLLLIYLCIFIILATARRNKKCIEDDLRIPEPTNLNNTTQKCEKNVPIDKKSNFTQPFYHRKSVRFNQMQRLHLIGGSVICNEEIEHAFLRLLYLYSCIFPAIQRINSKNDNYTNRDWITFQDVSDLDNSMQTNGRVSLHQHKKGEEEQLKRHLIQFIRELNHTNYHGNNGNPKLYRDYCSDDKTKTRHADADALFKDEVEGAMKEQFEDADPVVSETKEQESITV